MPRTGAGGGSNRSGGSLPALGNVNVTRVWRLLSWSAPIASVSIFIALYSLAAFLYPGGTRIDPARRGFSFFDNYWCDLLDVTTYGGFANPARPVALTAMTILCAGLGMLWWAAPVLFPAATRRARVVRASGVGCALLVPCVGSTFHDLAIHCAGLLGVVAFVATVTATGALGRRSTFVAWCVLVIVAVNYIVWQTRVGLQFLPFIQKIAFAAFLAWVILLSLRVRQVYLSP